MYDIYMFADVLKRLEDEGKTAEDHAADFLTVVSMYGGAMNESLEISNRSSRASFFVPACFQHTYFSTSSLWDEDSVLHPLIEVTRDNGKFRWINSSSKTIKLIDSCIGAHCNPTCPDKLVFLDAGKLLEKEQKKYLNDSETSQARKELPLCKSDQAVSIACLSLTYVVDLIKKKKKTADNDPGSEENSSVVKADRDSKTSLTVRDSIIEEDSGSDLPDSEEIKEEEADGVWDMPRRLTNDTNRDTDSVETPQELQPRLCCSEYGRPFYMGLTCRK
ncbi:hypothetical protein OS493_008822 [Desmophyllum pertusum]|uniref:Uncharacterized protein n=1 Tax=Desmophyllum pertusum TaxID=174260 RepID=A0A9X0CYM3_9CNID|nr:hypothetical protein OS493_008822 [Desmophyllum pertusum]